MLADVALMFDFDQTFTQHFLLFSRCWLRLTNITQHCCIEACAVTSNCGHAGEKDRGHYKMAEISGESESSNLSDFLEEKGFNPEENTKKKVAGSIRKEKRRWTESETLKLIDLLEERGCLCYEGQGLHPTLLRSFDRSVKQQQPTSPNNVA